MQHTASKMKAVDNPTKEPNLSVQEVKEEGKNSKALLWILIYAFKIVQKN